MPQCREHRALEHLWWWWPAACRDRGAIIHARTAAIRRRTEDRLVHAAPAPRSVGEGQSDDATVDRARRASRGLPVRVVVRKQGPRELAANVLHGLDHAQHAVVVMMDADRSHRPEDIPSLVDALDDGTDMAIGSRYLREAEIDRRWSMPRRWGSRAATLAARALWPCSDPLSGFFAVRREAIPPRETMYPIGYKIGLELAVRGTCQRH